jgi:hypothetical protein
MFFPALTTGSLQFNGPDGPGLNSNASHVLQVSVAELAPEGATQPALGLLGLAQVLQVSGAELAQEGVAQQPHRQGSKG